jgi:hypothetical protein
LFRLLFLQFLYNLSDERVIEESQYNLAYKWFLGLNPEDSLPDPSQLSRFRRHRLGANRVEKVLEHIVKQCVEKGLIQSKALILNSTHTIANASKDKPLDVLKKASNRLLKGVKKQHSGLYEKLPKFPKLEGTDEEKAPIIGAFRSAPAAISIFTILGPLGKYPGQSVTTCKTVRKLPLLFRALFKSKSGNSSRRRRNTSTSPV